MAGHPCHFRQDFPGVVLGKMMKRQGAKNKVTAPRSKRQLPRIGLDEGLQKTYAWYVEHAA